MTNNGLIWVGADVLMDYSVNQEENIEVFHEEVPLVEHEEHEEVPLANEGLIVEHDREVDETNEEVPLANEDGEHGDEVDETDDNDDVVNETNESSKKRRTVSQYDQLKRVPKLKLTVSSKCERIGNQIIEE